ncbi:probable histone-lysine N-methyltransferase set-23 [Zeugodacus cucurbitae]|nr:probable histone-lysine N-methyltransferase set-23 [Zeugodacus cucurbitae]
MSEHKSSLNISDFYEHEDVSLEYIMENVLYVEKKDDDDSEFQHLEREYNSILLNGCDCNSEKINCIKCLHGRNYKWLSEATELVLDVDKCEDLIYECSSACKCDPSKCSNRLVQNGPRAGLKVVHSNIFKSKGLISSELIPRGGFICEYAGEILSFKEASKRLKKYEQILDKNYILFMKEWNKNQVLKNPITTIIDPTQKGNIGRYINHSCDPNCEIRCVRIDCPIPKIAVFAKRDIKAGVELCFHYNGGDEILLKVQRRLCLCRSANCSGYMPYANIELP